MEDSRTDSQDSETSSLGSWILLSNDEAVADLASVELNSNSRLNPINKAVPKLADVEPKKNDSDIESDGISIISESEYSQSSESDDDHDNPAVLSKFGKYEDNENMLVKTEQFLKEDMKDCEEGYDNSNKIEMVNNKGFENRFTIEKSSFSLDEKKVLDVEPIGVSYTADKYINNEDKENIPHKKIEETLKDQGHIFNCLCNVTQKYELKKIVTWPSFLCTSVVIFAFLLFPYFSSKIDNTNTLDHPDIEQYDEHSLPSKNIAVVDPLVYCLEIQKDENVYHDYNIKRCVKKILKKMRKLRSNDVSIGFQSSGKKLEENEKNNNWITKKEMDTFQIKEKDLHKNDKKYKNKNRYNFISYENGKFDNKVSKANDVHISATYIKSHEEDYSFIQEDSENSLEKKNLFKLEEELSEMKNSLLEKEKLLRTWEKHLSRRELRIQQNVKLNNHEEDDNNFMKKNKFGKSKNRKGDFDKDSDSHERKLKRNKKHKNNQFISKKKLKNSEIHSIDERNHGHDVPEQFTKDYKEDNWTKNKNYFRMEGAFQQNQRKILGKKDTPSQPLRENINKKSLNKVNTKSQHSNYKLLRLQSIGKKNRTRILDDDNITISGDWYLNLIQGRYDIRKKEEKALWWFDRVEFRKNKRNRAFWYFQYMLNREDLRYRPRNI